MQCTHISTFTYIMCVKSLNIFISFLYLCSNFSKRNETKRNWGCVSNATKMHTSRYPILVKQSSIINQKQWKCAGWRLFVAAFFFVFLLLLLFFFHNGEHDLRAICIFYLLSLANGHCCRRRCCCECASLCILSQRPSWCRAVMLQQCTWWRYSFRFVHPTLVHVWGAALCHV